MPITRSRRMRAFCALVALALLSSACGVFGGDGDDQAGGTNPARSEGTDASTVGAAPEAGIELVTMESTGGPFMITLAEGEASTGTPAEGAAVVTGEILPTARIDALLDRLPDLEEENEDRQEFRRPAESLPPPQTGATIEVPFGDADGAGDGPATVDNGPLEVLRVQPEGDIDIAPSVSVTFNQPMIPLATLAQLSGEDVPVKIIPEVSGTWNWIGTRTIRFEHDGGIIDRLPAATTYEVEIPAGTTSESGGELAEARRFTFTTPTVQVERVHPHEDTPVDLEQIFVVGFDQLIDPAAVLETITLAVGSETVPIRLASAEELAADEDAARVADRLLTDRWLAFRTTNAMPADTSITLTIGPDTPSVEGPNTSSVTDTRRIRTYPPLTVIRTDCGWGDRCQPYQPFSLEFSNQLDIDAFDPSWVSVAPGIPGLRVQANWSQISVSGATSGNTTYKVTLAPEVVDVYGQTLGEAVTKEFDVGRADAVLNHPGTSLLTLDPMATSPGFSVGSINHDSFDVVAYTVEPTNWPAFVDYQQSREDQRGRPPFDEVWTDEIDVDGTEDTFVETTIPLDQALDGEHGHVVVYVSPTGRLADLNPNEDLFWRNRPFAVWVQATNLGIDVLSDQDELRVRVTDLETGAPTEGVALSLVNDTAETDADGLANLASLPQPNDDLQRRLLTATAGDDVSIFPADWAWIGRPNRDQLRWYVFDDRHIYKPTETVNIKGWVRELSTGSSAQLGLVPEGGRLNYQVYGPQGDELTSGDTTVTRLGGFDLSVEIPDGTNLGWGQVNFTLVGGGADGQQWGHSFQIQEFRRPEFEVTSRLESEGPYIVGEPATAAVDATYFAGGGLPDAEVEWFVSKRRTTYRPPNWEKFTFGVWVPWWFDTFGGEAFGRGGFGDDFGFGPPGFEGDDAESERFTGQTNAAGSHFLQMDFDGSDDAQPVSVSAQATVFDVNRQAWSSNTDLLVHPAALYVGMRTDRTFVRQGEDLTVALVATDIDGGVIEGHELVVEAGLLESKWSNGQWSEIVTDVETCNITSQIEPVECTFSPDTGGKYRISALIIDDQGRRSRSELTRWVSGRQKRLPSRNVELEAITLVPDSETYAPGDIAEILVQSPFADGHGLLTVSRNGLVRTEPFEMDGDSMILEVPITDELIPNAQIQVDVVGATERTDDAGEPLPGVADRPAYATAGLNLSIPPTSRTLTVDAVPALAELTPGDDTELTVTVTDAAGNPVGGAELAVVVVDEAVLALTGYQLADPLDAFYQDLPSLVETSRGRQFVRLRNPVDLVQSEGDNGGGNIDVPSAAPEGEMAVEEQAMSDGDFDSAASDSSDEAGPVARSMAKAGAIAESEGADAANGAPVAVRTNFDALAVFDPQVDTGADGTATIEVPLPDNLTRYRVMVVAVDGDDHFGSGESNITARLPLMVRPSAPRFLNFGDEFELPVVVQNQTDDDLEVDLAVRTTNLSLTAGAGRTITVPANDRVEVRFPAKAEVVGTARFQVVASSGAMVDAETREMPVYTPATTEAFATYGVVDSGVTSQTVLAPEGVFPQFGGLEINTSSTALAALTDAVLYMNEYRYRSSDSLASRILATAALNDVLAAFDAEGLPAPAVIRTTMREDIEALLGMQNNDGGFPYWQPGRRSVPYNTVHVAHALTEARTNGFTVDEAAYGRTLDYLRNIESRYESTYSQQTKDALSAYALHVRDLAGDRDAAKAGRLWSERGADMGLEAVAWIWPVLNDDIVDAEIERLFNNRATEEAGTATFATDYGEDAYVILHSNRRTDGLILDALISETPESDLIPKVVAGLLGNKTKGRWNNVQENVFILLALNDYFDAYETQDPDFVARIWLGDIYAAEHTYEGRTTDGQETGVTTSDLIEQGDANLVLSKEGEGRLYYRLGLKYAPDDLTLDPLDRGFVVARTYEAVDQEALDDVLRNGDGSWSIKAGAEVRVRLTMVADARRTHVALIDPMPAGFESINPALATSAVTPEDPNARVDNTRWWWGRWFDHQNLRDDRTEAFATFLGGGTYEYTYIARATTPGTFVVPPAKAEEMYHPETFGRSASETVTIR